MIMWTTDAKQAGSAFPILGRATAGFPRELRLALAG